MSDRLLVLAAIAAALAAPRAARASCASPANAIEAENCLTGTPQSVWDIPTKDAGDPTIQGFATELSVNQGSTVFFKIKSTASAYRLDIYRMGYYQGNGARLVATVNPSASLPQSQPACLTDSTTALIDCGNWAVSASWAVPANATSGIYFVKLTRPDTGGSSHVVFVVRNDASHSRILFQASDTTWQAYNDYGGENFYTCGTSPPTTYNSSCRAYKLSYNRPFRTRTFEIESWVFNSEYPMVRWLEANAYDVSYSSDLDSDRNGQLILNHKLWMSNGHDEYWSGNQRANVEAARAAGVHLAFLSANTTYWKTRWESSIDGSGTPFRTLVCYKETWANAVIDPADPPTWTGTWRDPRFSPPGDGGRPENALAGTLSRYVGGAFSPSNNAITVPQADGLLRFWRNTSVATLPAGQTATLALATIGDEVGDDEDNGFRPAGLFHVTTTPLSTSGACLLDYGSTTGACNITHSVTLYRHASGALVLSTATYHWSWGLDVNHDPSTSNIAFSSTPDVRMQQATVNFLADMGVQPGALQAGLVAAAPSADVSAPTSTFTYPASGASLTQGATIAVTGTASDTGGGVVAGVEISTDGGSTWHPATGRAAWSYTWTASVAGTATLVSRAVDDSGNLEVPAAGVSVTISQPPACTVNCTLWPSTAAPATPDAGPDAAVELGLKFRADVAGTVTGVRFYKGAGNTGTHVGNLWTSTGTRLATATFSGESASGWQQVSFSSPVAITANTVYVASYHTNVGHYGDDQAYFASASVDSPPLHALVDGASGLNGVFAYGSSSTFPSQGWNSSNYWVDVVFTPSGPAPTLSSITVTPTNPSAAIGGTQQFTATGSYSDGSSQNLTSSATWTSSSTAVATVSSAGLATAVAAGSTTIAAALTGVTGSTTLTVTPSPMTITTTSLPGGTVNVAYSASLAVTGGTAPYTWSIPSGLPPGLSLNASTGAITGTPTASGSYAFTAQVTDSAARTASKTLSITVLATLSSITVTPANPSAAIGGTQQFTATGSYSDGSSQNLTSSATWTSSSTAVATVSSAGLATAVSAGSTTIAAALSGVTGSTTLAVTPGPLTITTTSLPSGTLKAAYSASLAATGGTAPYTWSIANGLPPGLSLNASTGAITGTPTTAGSYAFTAQVTDSAAGSASRSLSITVVSQATIWPSTAAPVTADAGPDSAVELGVKFRADVAGTVTGIRFYKGTGNTGTHVGNLWSSTGTRLATATFSGETASGWQQVSFSSPVAITANTVYVASYHTNVGHYSDDLSYFATTGVDSPPLHALIDGASGFNGAFAYGSSSNFPSQGWKSSNYWVDVVFVPSGPAPTLSSITVTPANPSIATGGTQQFTATGSYSDGSSQNLTSSATWTSSSTAVATVSSAGLAAAVSAGSATISAALSGVTGSTTLTVTPGPLTITTTSLPSGTLKAAYSASLAATGGTAPYAWSIASGLPPGLSLNTSTGAIAGTPTTAGSYAFTAQVTDSAAGTASKALSITVVSQATIWPSTAVPGVADSGPDAAVELGVKFRADVNGTVTGVRFYKGTGNTGTHVGNLWTSTGTRLATATFSGETASGWQQVSFSSPVAVTANTVYVASYHTNVGHYSDDLSYFATAGWDSPPLHALIDGASGFNGVFAYGSSSNFPSQGWNSSNYWVDVVFVAGP